jgi:DMSO/TMAO reductase YedYZ heme-binding membrane subunit
MVFSLAAGVFDIAEVGHQVSRSDTALAVLAAVLAVMHFTAVLVGFEVQREQVTPAG